MILLSAKSKQKTESQGQSRQKTIYHTQQSQQEARDRGQSLGKPCMRDSLDRK